MLAAIDIGSNTLRLLISDHSGAISYHRKVTRLSGNFIDGCLSNESMARTTAALKEFSQYMTEAKVSNYRAVATEAVRRAQNSDDFATMVHTQTGIDIEIISGDQEAQLTTCGVLSVMDPIPGAAIIIDIGGGSTELICVENGTTKLQRSYPLGVVRLSEELSSLDERQEYINSVSKDYLTRLSSANLLKNDYQLIGTAGTVTTLSAMQLGLTEYDANEINNSVISDAWLTHVQSRMEPLTVSDREQLPGMEAGRGDLIIPGIQILKSLAAAFKQTEIRVSDSGLLEGIVAGLNQSKP